MRIVGSIRFVLLLRVASTKMLLAQYGRTSGFPATLSTSGHRDQLVENLVGHLGIGLGTVGPVHLGQRVHQTD